MSKVVSINQFKKTPIKKFGYLESAGIGKYEDMLDIQRGIIEELYLETEAFLKDIAYPLDKFFLDDKSARDFVSSHLVEAIEGGEETYPQLIDYTQIVHGYAL